MKIIGENIHIMSPRSRTHGKPRPRVFQDPAMRQVEAGAGRST